MLVATLNFNRLRTRPLGELILKQVLERPAAASFSKYLTAAGINPPRNTRNVLVLVGAADVVGILRGSFKPSLAVELLAGLPERGFVKSFWKGHRLAHTEEDTYWAIALDKEGIVAYGNPGVTQESVEALLSQSAPEGSVGARALQIHEPPDIELSIHIDAISDFTQRLGAESQKVLDGFSSVTLTVELDGGFFLRVRAQTDTNSRAELARQRFQTVIGMIAVHPGAQRLGLAEFTREAVLTTDDAVLVLNVEIDSVERAERFIGVVLKAVDRRLASAQ